MSEQDEIRRRIDDLGQWFHNIDLNGVRTAPNHFLGDYPNVKWRPSPMPCLRICAA